MVPAVSSPTTRTPSPARALPTADQLRAVAAARGEGDLLVERRLAALARLGDVGWPDRRDEAWTLTRERTVRAGLELEAPPADDVAPDPAPTVTGPGVTVLPLAEAAGDDRFAALVADLLPDAAAPGEGAPPDRYALLHEALRGEGWYVHVARGAEGAVVTVDHTLTAAGQVRRSQLLVVCEPQADVTVIERHRSPGLDGPALLDARTDVVLARAARLRHVSFQEWDGPARHLQTLAVNVGQEAVARTLSVTLGGALVRLLPILDLLGRGAEVEGLGVTFTDAGQHLEQRVTVLHDAADATSELLYKGAVQGDGARSGFVGDVKIPTAGTGALTNQTNRNIVLTDGAVAHSIPFLEIQPNELRGAGHASATGRLDDEALFYLESRGIDRVAATRLILSGFFGEVLGRLPASLAALRDDVAARIEARLDAERAAAAAAAHAEAA